MALTFSEKFRAGIGGKAWRVVEVTSDGSTTSINASDLDLNYITEAMIMNNVDLNASATWNPGSLAADAQESKDFTVTGAALGDFAMAAMGVDVVDFLVSAQVTVADTVTVTIANATAGTIDLATSTCYVKVIKNVGLSTRSGAYIILSPALTYTSDVVTILAIGY